MAMAIAMAMAKNGTQVLVVKQLALTLQTVCADFLQEEIEL